MNKLTHGGEGAGVSRILQQSPPKHPSLVAELMYIESDGWQDFEPFRRFLKQEALAVGGLLPYDPGFVYAIWAKGTPWFKFGKSKDVNRRFSQISPKLMHETEVIKVWATPFMTKAERLMHHMFRQYRGNGEWFDLPKEISISIFEDAEHDHTAVVQAAYWFDLLDDFYQHSPTAYEHLEENLLNKHLTPDAEINGWLQGVFNQFANRAKISDDFHYFLFQETKAERSIRIDRLFLGEGVA